MGGGHEQQLDLGRATDFDAIGGGQGHGNDDAVFAAVMSGQQTTPSAVAHALRSHPQQRTLIMTQVQQRFGNAFAQQVIAAMSTETLLHGPAAAPDPTPEILKNGNKLGDAADQYLSHVQSMLAPYTRARDALDAAAVAEIGRSTLGTLQLIDAALTGIDQQLAKKPAAVNCTTGTDPAAELDQAAELRDLDALRSRRMTLQVQMDALQMALQTTFTPLTFRGQPIPDVMMGAMGVSKAGHLDAAPLATSEWQHTYMLLQMLDKIGKTFATPMSRHDPEKLRDTRMELSTVAQRPIDFAFMRQALMGTGLWYDLNTDEGTSPVPGMPQGHKHHGPLDMEVCTDDGPLTELYKETKERAAQTGWGNDVGRWDQDLMFRFIRMGGTEAYVSVYNQIMSAAPDGRAAILHELVRVGLFDKMFTGLPWMYTKDIHDGLPYGHGDLKSMLQPHFQTEDKWGTNLAEQTEHTPSVHQMIDNASDNVGGVGGMAIGALNHVYNFLTLGFAKSYGEAQDAFHEGVISDEDHDRAMRQVATRTVVSMAFMMATAGTMRAAQLAPLPNLMAAGAAPGAAQVAATAGVEGATWGTAEMAMLDIGDMASGAKTQASSLPDYLLTMLLSGGAAAGSAALAHYLGGRSAKYLDANQRSRGQQLAVEDPLLTPIVDRLRGAAPGSTVRVRINSREAYALREAGLIDAETHRKLIEQFNAMPEIEVDVRVTRSLDEPAPTRDKNASPQIHDAPSLQIENPGKITGSIAAPDRVAQVPTTLAQSLPPGSQIVDMEGDEWVRYKTPGGQERIRFRADQASVGAREPSEGRNWSTETSAKVMSNRKVGANEGVHRIVGSAHGDVIPSDVGGVLRQPGVLDYEYNQSGYEYHPDEMHDVKPMKIEYDKPDSSAKDAPAMRAKRDAERGLKK